MLKSVFDFHEFVSRMSCDELDKFANSTGTTSRYIKGQLIYKKKIPRPEMIDSLVVSAKGKFTKVEFIHWLYDL